MLKQKTKFIIGAAVLAAIIVPPTYADVTKCVRLSTSMTITGDSGRGYTGTYGGVSVPIKMVGVCGGRGSSTIGSYGAYIDYDSSTSSNKYCFCRIISPAVSYWVYAGEITTDCNRGGCEGRCEVALTKTDTSDLTTTQRNTIRTNLLTKFAEF